MFLFNPLKTIVSGDKVRYKKDGFNLDLTYITERVLAMAFPGEGVYSVWRNALDDVASFLKNVHGAGHFRIYNLSEHAYSDEKFGGPEFVTHKFSFPDHHNPPVIYLFCNFY